MTEQSSDAERFTRLLQETLDTTKSETSYNPTRFQQMVAEFGAIEASRRVVEKADTSYGFTELWKANRIDLSVEALVIQPQFSELFSHDCRRQAKATLKAHEYDVA